MRTDSPLAAVAALLLHAAMIGAVIIGLSPNQPLATPPVPLVVDLVPAPPLVPPTPLPVAPPSAPTPPPKKRAEVTPRAAPKSAPAARETPAPQVQAPAASFEARPSASTTTAIATEPAASAPAAPSAPAKTSASIASYAASNRKPPYPRLSLRNEEQGTVVLRVLVNADGTAGAVELKKSSGFPLLDESAKNTVPSWRFNPATIDGKPVAEWYEVSIPFKLQNN
jgi:periplasmic protein TonB